MVTALFWTICGLSVRTVLLLLSLFACFPSSVTANVSLTSNRFPLGEAASNRRSHQLLLGRDAKPILSPTSVRSSGKPRLLLRREEPEIEDKVAVAIFVYNPGLADAFRSVEDFRKLMKDRCKKERTRLRKKYKERATEQAESELRAISVELREKYVSMKYIKYIALIIIIRSRMQNPAERTENVVIEFKPKLPEERDFTKVERKYQLNPDRHFRRFAWDYFSDMQTLPHPGSWEDFFDSVCLYLRQTLPHEGGKGPKGQALEPEKTRLSNFEGSICYRDFENDILKRRAHFEEAKSNIIGLRRQLKGLQVKAEDISKKFGDSLIATEELEKPKKKQGKKEGTSVSLE